MKIQETSEDITKGGILFPSPKTSYMEANTQMTKKQMITHMNLASMRLGHVAMTSGHLPCSLGIAHAPGA
jgi:hypothetical protein